MFKEDIMDTNSITNPRGCNLIAFVSYDLTL